MSVASIAPSVSHRAAVVRGLSAVRWYVRFFDDPVGCLCSMRKQFGPAVGIGNVIPWSQRLRQCAFVLDPSLNRHVLGDPAAFRTMGQLLRGPKNSALRRIRYGLTRMNDDAHRQQRRLLNPLFARASIDRSFPAIVRAIDRVVGSWPLDRPSDVWKLMRQLAVDVACAALFGHEDEQRALKLSELLQSQLKTNFSSKTWLFPLRLPGAPYRELLKNAERIEKTVLQILDDHRGRASAGPDAFATLAAARDRGIITREELIGQATILFLGSYENVGNSLTWTVFLLAQHPHIMAELADELRTGVGDVPRDVEQLEGLPFLDQVVSESLRILPPVPFLLRSARRDVKVGNLQIHSGDRVICSPYLTHHCDSIYPQPQRFHPHRWEDVNPGRFEYLPFGAGPHACIGYGLGMAIVKAALAIILKRLRFRVVPGTRVNRQVMVTMRPRHGLPMTLHRIGEPNPPVPVRGDIHDMVDFPD